MLTRAALYCLFAVGEDSVGVQLVVRMLHYCIAGRPIAPLASIVLTSVALATNSYASPTSLGEVIVVTAARQVQRAGEVLSDISVLDEEEIRAFGPNSTINDVLARQPGVEINSKGGIGTDSSVFLRGSNTTHALVLVDGIRMGSTTLGYANWGYIPIEQIDRIEILRGPSSALYGADAIGGVIQIFTKRGSGSLKPFAEIGYGTWNTSTQSVGVSGTIDAIRLNLQASKKQSDSYSAINNPRNAGYNSDNDGYSITSSSGSFVYAPNQSHEVGLSYLFADGWNRYDYSVNKSQDWRQEQTVYGLSVFSTNKLSDRWTSTFRAGKTADRSYQLADGSTQSQIHSNQVQYQWQNDIGLDVGKGLAALERTEQEVSGSVDYTLTRRTINSMLFGWTGAFEKHRAQISARVDDNSQYGSQSTGSAAYGYQVATNWRVNLSASTGFKAPSFNDMYWPGAGNPNLKPETSNNRELSIRYDSDGQSASVTLYRNEVANLIEWAPITVGSSTWIPSNVAKANLGGATLSYAGEFEDIKFGASLDLQNPEDARTHNLLRYRAREVARLSISREFGLVTIGGDLLASGTRFNDAANTQALDPYQIVNVFANYRIRKDWSAFVRINNLFNREYVLVQDFETPKLNIFAGVRYSPK